MRNYVQILIMCILSICLIGGVVAAAGTDGVTAPENGSMMVAPGLDVEPAETETPLDEEIPAAAGETVTAAPNPASTIILGSATVEAGKPAVIPVKVANLTEIEGIGGWVFYNQGAGTVTSVNLTGPLAGANLTYNADHPGHLQFAITTTASFTVGAAPVVQIAEIHFDTYGGIPGNYTLSPDATYYSAEFNESYFAHVTEGWLNITPPLLPDLEAILVDPPHYLKKYADGSLHLNQTVIIKNNGYQDVTDNFKMGVNFGLTKENIPLSDDIVSGENVTYHIIMNILPECENTTIDIKGSQGYERWYEVTTKGNISPGRYKVGFQIDVENTISEINETNNNIEVEAEVTYPDLIPIWKIEFVRGIPSSNTTILDTLVTPGIWRVTFGAKNIGNVFAVPTTLNYSMNGKPPQPRPVPRLEPGETWTNTIEIVVDRAIHTYRVEVNADRAEAETNYANNTYEDRIGSVAPVTIVLPKVSGSTNGDVDVFINITNVSSTAPVTVFQIPVKYDPTVCNVTSYSAIPGVTVTNSYGLVTLTANNLTPPLVSGTKVATLKMRALADTGRTSVLDTQKSAHVKTDGDAFLELEITRGAFTQKNITDAAVTVYASPRGPFNQNQTVSVTVQNQRLNPVTVSANLAVNDVSIWSMQNISLAGRASKTFTVNTWKPGLAGTYFLNATITGDDLPAGNFASRSIDIDDYRLEMTDQNRWYWEYWYGYNKTVLKDEYFMLGTYFTANQSSMVNATLAITYPDGTPVNLTDKSVFELYYYPAQQRLYGYNSDWNYAAWYYIRPKQLGDFNYSITLEARGESAYVNGTIKVREPNVDIKVMNTTLVTTENVNMTFEVFNRTPSENRKVQILLSAGADGRTLQGLESLIGYPHGCPEQVMSPALAALRVKQYYEERGALNDRINSTVRTAMQNALNHMNPPNGYNAQQLAGQQYGDGSGGWAWGKWSTPSMFYTFYPNYVITELLRDNDPAFWNVTANMDQIDLNASANWLIGRQKDDGRWSDWSYISNDVEWTGFISENLANEYPYLNDTMKIKVNASLNKSCDWLVKHDYTNEPTKALSYAILGLVAIREHGGIGDADAIDVAIVDLRGKLDGKKTVSGTETYWSDPSVYGTFEPTASAVLALNRSGTLADDLSGGITHLIGNRAGRSYSGGWGSTRTSAAVIDTLTVVVPQKPGVFTVDLRIEREDGTLVWSRNGLEFNKTSFGFAHTLSADELSTLYGSGTLNDTARVVISNKDDTDPELIAKLSVSIDSFEQVPKSIATATIPDRYIDPLATDFELQIDVPAPGSLKEGDEHVVGFTIYNTKADSIDQNTMIIEITISNAVNFTGSANGADKAYYLTGSTPTYITHMYNATDKVLYIYPGSDNASAPSVLKGRAKTFSVPLKFGTSGNTTVEARVYPMYNDTWMALGTGSTYVLGYGNVTLAAVDETDAPVAAEFYVAGGSIGTGTSVNTSLLEGAYPVAIKHGDVWINSSVNVALGESVTYTAHFASDRSVPYIAQAEGTAGEIRLMPPAIVDTTDDASPNHWNAKTKAMKSFNSTISSSGGRAILAVDIPKVSRTVVNDTGTFTLSVGLNDNPAIVSMYNGTTWTSYGYNMSRLEDRLTISDVDTSEIKQINITFTGREYGDVNDDGIITTADAFLVVKARFNQVSFTENQRFYADVNNDGLLSTADAFLLVKQRFGQVDANYQPI